ncbi:MAG: PAS domain S-box protein, partial [Ignavibacteriaceae bacterium]
KIEKQLHRLNRTLRIISECNQKIIRAKTEKDILKIIPETLVKFGNYRFVWIGYAVNDKEKSIKPVTFAGLSKKFFDQFNISWSNNKFGQGPTGTSVRTGRYIICQNIKKDPLYAAWRERAIKWDYSSSVALPLKDGNNVFGVLNIYATEAGAFNEEEIRLLEELADDISYGVISLRTKEKHEQAKKSLAETTAHNQFLANILDLSSQPFAIGYPDGKIGVFNKAYCNLLGYNEEELKKLNWKDLTPDEWKTIEEKKLAELELSGNPVRYEKEYFSKNGKRIPVELLVHKSFDEKDSLKYFYAFVTDISERKKIEEALLYTQFSVDKARDAIFWIQEDGKLVYVNEAACKSLEYSKEELLSLSLFDIDPYFNKDIWPEHWKKTRELQSSLIETHHKTKNGKIFPVEVSINFMSFAGKEYHSAFVRDISERKKSEEQLKLTQFGIDNSQVGVFQIDEDGNILYANKYATQILGYSSNDIIKLKIWDLNPEIKKETWKDYRDRISKQDMVSIDTKHIKKDGTEFPVEVHVSFIEFDNKTISFSFVKDITERKLIEKELKESEEKFRNIFNQSPVGIYRTTPDGKILDVNQTILSMLKYSSYEELFEKNLEKDKFHTETYPRKIFRDQLEKEGEIKNFETTWLRKDLTEIVVRENAKVIKDENGKILYYEGTAEDITEFKDAQRKLRESEKLFNTLADSGHYILYLINKELKFKYVNKYASQYFSSKPEQMINQPVKNFYSVNSDRIALSDISSVFQEGRSIYYENSINLNDKETWFGTRFIPLKNENNEIDSVMGLTLNISEQKITEKRIRKEVKRTQTLVKVALQLNSTLNIQKVLDMVCSETAQTLNVPIVSILLFNKMNERLEHAKSTGISGDIIKFIPSLSESISDEIKNNNEPVITFSNIQNIINQNTANSISSGLRTLTFTRMLHNDELIGVLGLLTINEERKFNEDETYLLQGIAGQAALAIHNAHLLSEHKKSEELLRNNEQILKESQKIARLGHYTFNIKTGFWNSSDTLDEVFGIPDNYKRDVAGWLQLIHPEDIDIMKKYLFNDVIKLKHNFDKEYRIIRPNDKQERWVHGLGQLHPDENGKIIQMLGTIQDITERKNAEKELKLSESRLYEAQHLAHVGNWELNLKTKKVYWSDEAYRIFGFEPGQMEINLDLFYSRLNPEDRNHINKLLDDSINENTPFSYDHPIILPNDNVRIVHSEGKVIRNASGEALTIYGTVQDITERKKFESEIISAKERAEDMSRLKSNFLANMSHELRTPLFGILGLSELLTHEITNAEQKDMIDAVYESSKRLSETLNLILDLSKIENNKLELNAVKFDIGIVSVNVINTFKEVAKKKGIYLKTDFNIPELNVRLDKRAYESILNNLINNAIKFTKSGGVTMKLSLEIIDNNNYVVLKVKDTGIGIAKEDFNIIFDEFRQASEGMSRNFEGSGLGLNITKKFVEKMNGSISVESELGKGTEFTVKLPIVKSVLKEITEKEVETEKKEIIELDFVPSLLLVDDDINVKSILSNYLSKNFRLSHVLNGADAVNSAKKEKFNAILMDINLKGGLDGIKTTKEIRKIEGYENIPIIACTAFAMAGDKDEFLSAGCSHYIAKPFSKNEIISLLKEVFSKTN